MITQELILRTAVEKGYTIDKEGNALNKHGVKLSLSTTKNGYHSFNIKLVGVKNARRVFVHRLQGFQKFGEDLFIEGNMVRHLNNISIDNSYKNIGLGTHSQNMMDMDPLKRSIKASNLTYDHASIIQDREKGLSYKEIMIKHSIKSKGTVSYVITKSLTSKGVL